MDQQSNKSQKSGGNGFILGVIVGVMIALLFTTKKGRAILRDITEKGIDKLSSLEELTKKAENGEYDDGFEEEDDYVKSEPTIVPQTPEATKSAPQSKPVEVVAPKEEKKEAPAKPAAKPTPAKAVDVVKEDLEPELEKEEEKADPEPEVEEREEEPKVKAPTKVIQGRRWFRGLRKRG
jgi:gas vesicle protein